MSIRPRSSRLAGRSPWRLSIEDECQKKKSCAEQDEGSRLWSYQLSLSWAAANVGNRIVGVIFTIVGKVEVTVTRSAAAEVAGEEIEFVAVAELNE